MERLWVSIPTKQILMNIMVKLIPWKKLSAKCIKVNGEEIESFAEVSGSQMLRLRKVQIPKSAINMISSIFSMIKWSDLLSAFIFYSSILFQYDKYWLILGETSETQSSLSLSQTLNERAVCVGSRLQSCLCWSDRQRCEGWRVLDIVYLHDLLHCNYLKGKVAFPPLNNEYVVLHHQQPPSTWWEGNYYYFAGCFSKGPI